MLVSGPRRPVNRNSPDLWLAAFFQSGVSSGLTRRVWVAVAASPRSTSPCSKALADGAWGSRSLDPAWSYSSVAEDEKHVTPVRVGALKSAQLSGHCGLRVRIGAERRVANDPYATFGVRLVWPPLLLDGAASALVMLIDCVACAPNLWHNPRYYGREQPNHGCGISRIPQMPNESVSPCERRDGPGCLLH